MDAQLEKIDAKKKIEFVMAHPVGMPASQVVEKAIERGVEGISERYVWGTRHRQQRKRRKGTTKMGKNKPAVTKTAFILGHPMDMPAADVVARGAKAGQKLDTKMVHVTRSSHRAKLRKRAEAAAKANPSRRRTKTQSVSVSMVRNLPRAAKTLSGAKEHALRSAIEAIGFDRAKEVFHELAVRRAEEFAAYARQLR